jgi:hypothetical protein
METEQMVSDIFYDRDWLKQHATEFLTMAFTTAKHTTFNQNL